MARGQKATVGDTRVAQNGYHYTKTEEGWKLTHHLVAEEQQGRPIDKKSERVIFIDGDRSNLDPDNIRVVPKTNGIEQKKEKLRERIAILQAELEELERG